MATPNLCRYFAWANVGMTFALLVNNYLDFWQEWPGVWPILATLGLGSTEDGGGGGAESGDPTLSLIQLCIYVAALVLPALYVLRSPDRGMRPDGEAMHRMNLFIVRWAFWAILLVGLGDAAVSFLRIESLLEVLVGDQITSDLGNSHLRVPYVHLPLIIVGFFVALVTRTLGFPWLALLVVLAELLIVVGRFIFSYEQAFMADLVRFWYAALFLIASAYTLYEDGHVRVDVLYARFNPRAKAMVNAVGSVVLGIIFCWVILILGLATKSSIINAPLITLEVTQSGFGMYIKYLMAGFLGLFAVTMMIQFSSFFLESMADRRGEPGIRRTMEPLHDDAESESRAF